MTVRLILAATATRRDALSINRSALFREMSRAAAGERATLKARTMKDSARARAGGARYDES